MPLALTAATADSASSVLIADADLLRGFLSTGIPAAGPKFGAMFSVSAAPSEDFRFVERALVDSIVPRPSVDSISMSENNRVRLFERKKRDLSPNGHCGGKK